MNVYVILLHRMERFAKQTEHVSLESAVVAGLVESARVQLLDIIACMRIVNAVLVCGAPDNSTVARLPNTKNQNYPRSS